MFRPQDIHAAHAELCRRSFYDFIKAVRPSYEFNWHHLVLIDALQQVAERKIMRLVVQMPPRHGKSELVSRLFPAWILARDPDEQIILASYAATLANSMNRDAQRVMASDKYQAFFQRHTSDKTGHTQTGQRFDVLGSRGYLCSVGVGGGITGFGCTVGIIDDPVKNAQEADSQTYRENNWDWYTSTFRTRFEPAAVEVICQTRWHEDDLAGRILARDEEGGVVLLSLPAIAEDDEPNRAKGSPLWDGKYNLDALRTIGKDVGTRTWNALYQQRPAPDDGGIIRRSWFPTYNPATVDLSGLPVHFYVDTAYTDKEKNDPTGFWAYVKKGADFYIVGATTKYLDFTDQVKHLELFCRQNGYTNRSLVRVEPKATGKSVVQVLKKNSLLNIREAISPTDTKVSRVNSISATLEAGRVHFPKTPWADEVLAQLAAFPNAAHDEYVDCLTGMVLNERGGGILASG